MQLPSESVIFKRTGFGGLLDEVVVDGRGKGGRIARWLSLSGGSWWLVPDQEHVRVRSIAEVLASGGNLLGGSEEQGPHLGS